MKIGYYVQMERRALADENYDLLYANFLEGVKDLPNTWNLAGIKPLPDIGADTMTSVSITRILKRGMKGYIYYLYRGDYLNDSQDDDRLIIDFKSDKGLTKELVEILPTYISAFKAYFLTVEHETISTQDWNKVINKVIKYHPRKDVLRINAINYYDRELCRNAFNLTPEEILERLTGNVEIACIVNDGIYFVYTSEELPEEEHRVIDKKIRDLLVK